jgi:hypothetical protein
MQAQPYCTELGATAACTRRLCEAASYSGVKLPSRQAATAEATPESFIGDSWFTGIKVVEWAAEQSHSYFGALKTSTKCTPYQELIDTMHNYPSGSYLVMECTSPKGHNLICIGYKYSASKVLVFLGDKNAGSTKPGEPYVARFPDSNGNVAQRNVQRPGVISKYFTDSNAIDSHNHVRQFELALEKRWVDRKGGWFRVITTLIGMSITDCWRAYKHALDREITIKAFADCMAYDCIYNCLSDSSTGGNAYLPTDDDVPRTVGGRQSDVSTVTAATTSAATLTAVMAEHPFKDNPEREQGGRGRPIRRKCKAEGCKKTYHKQCFHRQCLQFKYMSAHGWVRGVFYCPEHFNCHYAAVLEDNGNV